MASIDESHESLAGRQNCDKALQTLDGIITGIACDQQISPAEITELQRWLQDTEVLRSRHPAIQDAVETVRTVLADGQVSADELLDLRHLCRRIQELTGFYDLGTHAIQRLHGILHGVLADGTVSEAELRAVRAWLEDHEDIRQYWPLAEIETVLIKALLDGKLTQDELAEATAFFASFTGIKIAVKPEWSVRTVKGICATAPDIQFVGQRFCITGRSEKAERVDIENTIIKKGGRCDSNVNEDTDYVIVCGGGSKCWAYAGYGRKIEAAMELRRNGIPIVLAHERDLWDALV
jgi:NAD-dependent DNA ligase